MKKNLVSDFEKRFGETLGPRIGFKVIISHLAARFGRRITIIETGTARGQWIGTLIWDWYLSQNHKAKGYSLDTDLIESTASATKHVHYIVGDLTANLGNMTSEAKQCALLYLGTREQDNSEKLFHLATLWAALPSGCLIVVDDKIADKDKDCLIQMFMSKLGIKPMLVSDFQTGWIKP